MIEYYLPIRTLHLISVTMSFVLYTLRGVWMLQASSWYDTFWARRLPHINDTVLLTAGILLAIILQQYPGAHAWLTAKFVGLLVHIGLGFVAFRGTLSKRTRIIAWIGSLLAFGYIVGVALTRDPLVGLLI